VPGSRGGNDIRRLMKTRFRRHRFGNTTVFFASSTIPPVAGGIRFGVTLGGIILAIVPSNAVGDVWNFEVKTNPGIMSIMVPAVLLFRLKVMKSRREEVVVQEVEVAPD
jgi:hypothetical protein